MAPATSTTTPEWLSTRGGSLARGYDGHTWLVLLNGSPQYRLSPVPAAGRYNCAIVQTVNSRRIEHAATYATSEEAIRSGLEALRGLLGW
jgi:hypothetical protein